MVKVLSITCRIACLGWLISIQFIPETVFADDDLSIIQYIPNYLSIDYGLDNDHGRDTFVFANLGLTLKDRVIFGIGEQTEKVSQSEETLDNKTYLLGYNYFPYSVTQIGAEYEFWGDRDKVTIDSFRVVLAVNTGSFAITVTPELRKIKVSNDSQCDESIDSDSVKVDLSVDLDDNYTLNTSYISYDYGSNLTELGSCVDNSEKLEIESRIDSVANDRQIALGLDFYDDTGTYGVSLSKSKTALYSLDSKSLSFYASTDQFDDWSLTATIGITENTDDSSTMFATGTITYYW